MSRYIFKCKDETVNGKDQIKLDFEADRLPDLIEAFNGFVVACGFNMSGQAIKLVEDDKP